MSVTPWAARCLGKGHGPGFGHSEGDRPGSAQHQHVFWRDAQGGVVNASGIVWPFEYDGWPSVLVQVRGRGGFFQDGSVWRERAF